MGMRLNYYKNKDLKSEFSNYTKCGVSSNFYCDTRDFQRIKTVSIFKCMQQGKILDTLSFVS